VEKVRKVGCKCEMRVRCKGKIGMWCKKSAMRWALTRSANVM
jgi:hypothetical protein